MAATTLRSRSAILVLALVAGGTVAGGVQPAGAQAAAPGEGPVAPEAGASRVQRPDDPFLPSRHGFAFVNRFTGSSLPPELRDAESGVLAWARGVAETYADLPEEFGLCGGMSLSAADYYLAGAAVPGSDAAPEQGTPLYEAIYQRQRDSLGVGSGYVLKFAHWMALPDVAPPAEAGADPGPDEARSTSALTRQELPEICRALERRQLVPLGLVLSRAGRGKLWNNHQVLAYALERPDDATLHILIYDPNYPGDDRCVLRIEGLGVGLMGLDPQDDADAIAALGPGRPGTSGDVVRAVRLPSNAAPRAIRGVFAMPYEPIAPPDASALPGERGGVDAAVD